jgi:hypothetical protein
MTAGVFEAGKHFLPSLMFAGKVITCMSVALLQGLGSPTHVRLEFKSVAGTNALAFKRRGKYSNSLS